MNITRNDGVVFIVSREEDQEGPFYRVRARDDSDAVFGDSRHSGTAESMDEITAMIETARVNARTVITSLSEDADEEVMLSKALFLASREQVASVCDALGVTEEDGVVEEGNLPGWTYMTGWGELCYMVQYEDGTVGAEFGECEIRSDTLAEAESELCTYMGYI